MKIYNTLTRKVEDFIPWDNSLVTMYTCGPTVYHYAHIGNLRNYIMQDVLEKSLEYLGYNVKRVMNITDVGHLTSDSDSGEDKMLKGAKRENKTVFEIADYYTKQFFCDLEKLNIRKPKIIAKATDYIDEYIKIIEVLLEKGYAYESGGNIYFDISKLDDYYVLTNHKEDEMVVGVRDGVEKDDNKRNQGDFALWFTKSKFQEQELKWDSPFGVGYPGWHIECSAIAIKNLGERLDIHCGGVDNIFPHHTNEIAQSEAYLGHKWCNYWVHTEHLNDENGKMSKSKNEFLTLNLLEEKGYLPISYRLYCLLSHYRKPLVFKFDGLKQTENIYRKLKNKIQALKDDIDGEVEFESVVKYQDQFKKSLENDLNTANAVTVLYDVLKDENLNNLTKLELIKEFDQVLSLDLLKEDLINDELKSYILSKIEERIKAKEKKDYELADKIKDELLKKGILLKDTKNGTLFEMIKQEKL